VTHGDFVLSVSGYILTYLLTYTYGWKLYYKKQLHIGMICHLSWLPQCPNFLDFPDQWEPGIQKRIWLFKWSM